MVSFATARRMMVDGQIRTSDVTDGRILAAMGEVPRERFVPADQTSLAYLDRDLPVSGGGTEPMRYLLKPMVLAKLIQAAHIRPQDRVLDIGCTTGYSTAVLARLAERVVGLEEDPGLASQATRILSELGVTNASVRQGVLTAGDAADGPYDVILINGAVERLPEGLIRQLKEGGQLLCVLRQRAPGKAMRFLLEGGDVSGRPIFDAMAPVLPGFVEPPVFAF